MSNSKRSKQSDFMKEYELIHEGFTRFCSSRCYGIMDTEDLVQESVMVAFDNFEKMRERKALLAYLMRTASNILNSKLRRRKFHGFADEAAFEQLKSLAPNPEVAADIDLLYRTLRKLPTDTREALELFEIAGFSIKEIAEMKGCTESAMKVRLHRGRKRLKEELTPQNAELTKLMTSFFLFF
ncbi:MAG: RNA polymerase sigma-70 factor (ECF subfamily) [Flavobacteriales bacterium]|jgi:RNA polymerase sigma-70 factor (ECF subfamily)